MPTALAGRAEHGTAPDTLREKPVTDRAPIDHLWGDYRRRRSESSRNHLITHYMSGHVRRIAERMRASLPVQVDVDDLTQQGYLGLVEAIDRFDENRGVKFETFSSRRIYGAMQDYLRSTDPMPRLMRSRAKRVRGAVENFRKSHGRPPDATELKDQLNLPESTLRQMILQGSPPATVSFNASQSSTDQNDEGDAMDGFIDQHERAPLYRLEKKDLRHWLTHGFDRRDRLIVVLYYYESMTMKEVGITLGCSESRISQRLDTIILTLKSRLTPQDMEREFFQ